MRRHGNLLLSRNRILTLPQTRHSLPLRIEVDSTLAVEIARPATRHRLLVPREAEHRQRHRNRDINTQLAGLDLLLELGSGGARLCEDGRSIAVGVGVDESNGFIGCWDVETDQDRPKDLFCVAFHVGFHVGDYGWTDLVYLLA
jgi:hypothetical protein